MPISIPSHTHASDVWIQFLDIKVACNFREFAQQFILIVDACSQLPRSPNFGQIRNQPIYCLHKMKTVQTSVRQAYPARCVTHAKGAKKEAFLQVKKRKGLKKQKLKINLTASHKKNYYS